MTAIVLTERETREGRLVAISDEDVIGQTFENGDVSLTVEEAFYAGEDAERDVTVDRFVECLHKCTTANLVGTTTVDLAVEHGFVDEENVLEFDGTKHAQLMWV